MNDEQIKKTLAEVGADWLIDPHDEHCQAAAIRHLVAAAEAAERERCAQLCEQYGRQGREAEYSGRQCAARIRAA